MADFAELEKRAWYALTYGATQEQIAAMLKISPSNDRLEKVVEQYRQALKNHSLRPYQRQFIAATASVYRKENKEPRTIKPKAKGPRNRWGTVK